MRIVLDTNVLLVSLLIVTNDKNFNVLKNIEFPSVDVITSDQFLKELEEKA